ncbi:putative sucrase ferredoxin domain-containing protein [Golovinomyces cichoracearum]|uniref:Defect at low temperature protein 1 n=1 Tax=Golovinomyces cichoracearum TaxID=62708 RepID=A0A420J274_9PEZI|nr:putative sucrase ferredoxin domain-containing protein [Golovinomyces cichoracearum]
MWKTKIRNCSTLPSWRRFSMKLNILSIYFYVGSYTILNIVLVVLLLVTPGDAIRQALDNKQPYNVFAIAGTYFLTLILAITLYASRKCAESATLKAIPKTWIPIEKGDVSKKVREMIILSLHRSAVIAWNSRPRIVQEPMDVSEITRSSFPLDQYGNINKDQRTRRDRSSSKKSDQISIAVPSRSIFGEIIHDGWSSPLSSDFPDLHYMTVISELPHLTEAKVVSLVSPHANNNSESPELRHGSVDILRRPMGMSFRDYIGYLCSLNIITTPDTAFEFLSLYEYARFSENPLNEIEFKKLVESFAEILRGIKAFNPESLTETKGPMDMDFDEYFDSTPTPMTPQSLDKLSVHSSSDQSGSDDTIQRSYV